MTQQPPPYVPYASPAREPMPACVLVISIIGICLGGLTVLGRLGFVVFSVGLTSIFRSSGTNVGYSFSELASWLLFAAFGGWLLLASIGCLRRIELARLALVLYAMVYPIALVIGVIVAGFSVGPIISTQITHTGVVQTVTPQPTSVVVTAVVTEIVISLVFMVYPVFILIFMRRPGVRAVFS